jgi:hypothetical protein
VIGRLSLAHKKTIFTKNVLSKSSHARHLLEKLRAHPLHMRPFARYAIVTQIRWVRLDRRFSPALRAGAAALRFRDGWRPCAIRAMRRAFGARREAAL